MNAGHPEARIVSAAPVSTGAVVWRSRGQLYVTVVVKASFALVNEHAMELTEPIELFRSELHHRENPSRSVRATSDMAPYLSHADVVLTGHAYAPSGEPATMVPVRLAVFREQAILDKTVHVYGDRKSGAAATFEKVPLMYERALGGVGFDENPMGIGMQAGGTADLHAASIEHPTDPTKVAGFGPISRTWPARRRLLGKMDRKALDKPIILLPDGFDWSYFQAAPSDQQIDFLRGDEWVVLEGMHPSVPQISSRLPSARVTGTVSGLADVGQVRGLEFHADILRIDADAQSCSVVWRSSMPVADEAAIEALEIVVGLEIAGQTIEWSEGDVEIDDAEIDSLDTMDVDDSALIEEGASIDESDFAKTIPREDKLPDTPPRARAEALPRPAPPPRPSAPQAAPAPRPSAPQATVAFTDTPRAEKTEMWSPDRAALGLDPAAARPERTSLWTPEMAAKLREAPPDLGESPADAALRESLAKRGPGDLDDATADADTRKVKAKGEEVRKEGTLKLAPVKEAFVQHAPPEEAPQLTEKITISALPAARPPMETVPLLELSQLAQPSLPFGAIATSAGPARAPMETVPPTDEGPKKPSMPFVKGPPGEVPVRPKPGPKRFDGTFALSMDDQAHAGHKAAVPFASRAPVSVPRPAGGPRAAIPGAPWAPKNKPQAPPKAKRFDQTVTAIGDAPSRKPSEATQANAAVTEGSRSNAPPATISTPPVTISAPPVTSTGPLPPPAPVPAITAPLPPPPSSEVPVPSGFTDVPPPPAPPIAPPPPRAKLPPLRPTLPRGTPAPRLAANREAAALKSLEAVAHRATAATRAASGLGPPAEAARAASGLGPSAEAARAASGLGPPAEAARGAEDPRSGQRREGAPHGQPRPQDAVPVVHKTPFTVASFPWQLKARTDSLVVVVKATADLVQDGPASLRSSADSMSGDVHEGNDPQRTLLYSTDFAVFKPRADVTLSGHVYAPSGSSPAAQARMKFGGKKGGFERRIAVFGERRWQKAGIKIAPSEPRPFKKVPLVYERAFGGAAFEKNPSGLGIGGDLLPQLEDPASLVKGPNDAPEPACFAAIPSRWASRRSLLGTFDAEWKKSRWPYFPDDFDWAFFQAAPASQQVEHASGDEAFELAGVSAEHPLLRGTLPGVRPRCFAQKTSDAGGEFHEVLLRLDTIAFEPDRGIVTLVWRGVIDVADDTAEDVSELFVIDEPVAGPSIERAEALSKYRAAKLAPLAPEEITEGDTANDTQPGGAPEPKEIAELSSEAAAKLRADVELWLADGASFDGRDLAGADLSDLDFSGRSMRSAVLARCSLARCKLGRSELAGAQLGDADLSGADLMGADLSGADLTRAILSGADLTGAKIGGASFAEARAEKARFNETTGAGASFVGANLKEARFERASLASADFTRAALDDAVLDAAELSEVRLYDATGTGTSWNGAKLDGARADGVVLKRSSLQRVQARSSVWDRAVLDESTFLGAVLAESGLAKVSARGAIFSGADLSGSRLRRGVFQGASFLKASLMAASLEGADLEGADLRGANLHGAETHRAKLTGAKLDLAIVTQTKLAGAQGGS